MGQESTDIREAIRSLAGSEDLSLFESRICVVSNVNLTNRTCDCTPVNGDAEFIDVLLSVNKDKGFVLIPSNGSMVAVTQLNESDAFISMVSEIDGMLLNGDNAGGLIKIVDLTTKLNLFVSQTQAQLALISTAIAGVGGAYTPGTLSTFNKTNYENLIVKHGT
jgi:hypothetical protein